MDIKELFDMAKAANTKATVKITIVAAAVQIRWLFDHHRGPDWTRNLPWSALGDDRDPYRAVREYIKMDAFYMEGIGGVPDRTHNLFGTTAPASSTLPILTVTPADLLPGDIVEVPESLTRKEVVRWVRANGCDYEVEWAGGGSEKYSHNHTLRIIRRGRRHDN